MYKKRIITADSANMIRTIAIIANPTDSAMNVLNIGYYIHYIEGNRVFVFNVTDTDMTNFIKNSHLPHYSLIDLEEEGMTYNDFADYYHLGEGFLRYVQELEATLRKVADLEHGLELINDGLSGKIGRYKYYSRGKLRGMCKKVRKENEL